MNDGKTPRKRSGAKPKGKAPGGRRAGHVRKDNATMDDGLQGYSLVESPLDLPEATPDEQPEANNAVTAEDTSEERGAVELANDVGIGSPRKEEKPDEIDLELLDISKRLFELLVAIRKKPEPSPENDQYGIDDDAATKAKEARNIKRRPSVIALVLATKGISLEAITTTDIVKRIIRDVDLSIVNDYDAFCNDIDAVLSTDDVDTLGRLWIH